MHIRWTTPAADDMERIARYIRQHNPQAARDVTQAILNAVATLESFPHAGRPGKDRVTRELVIARFPAYIVVYHVDDARDTVEIWHVWNAAQDWH